ncbi:Ethanolamine utilization protein EutQ [Roseovarius albus]|uniref:Ethanolamine utilization protein EutQ n=1 Tax=Roseovarius albus TaxID=1247867 RepID=A0A1X6ZIS2_9RHOB|nr:ethanolamine utilization protein EutQ [Roseovarius albus]SLN52875.1 Ethanolamine utilization protein EutQ [Roseovarius albus]
MTKAPAQTICFEDLSFRPRFEYGDMAQVNVVSGTEMGTKLGTGFARFTKAAIPWTVQYDEVVLVLSGQLTARTKDSVLTAGPQDSIWLPKGTELTYESEDALVFYAIEPANWAEAAT